MNPWDSFNLCVSVARRIVRDEDVARDIATDICGIKCEHDTVAKLAQMAKWRALDHVRKGRLEIVRGYDVERAIDNSPTPEQELEAKQTRKALAARLGEVEMFVLDRTGEGFSDEEIATKLSKTAVAIRHIRSRARRKLISEE